MEKGIKKAVMSGFSIPDGSEKFFEQAQQIQEVLMMYQCAISEVRTKLEVLNNEMSVKNNRNPIETIKYRVKKPKSIVEKLIRKGYPISVESVIHNLNDVAGVRVICSFVEDIYTIARMLVKQDDITLLEVKDYIKNPKPNGYRSYHMIIEIPVFFSDKKQPMKVEVQIRTMAMDFWASLEHQVNYKKDVENAEEISCQLKKCADVIAETDLKMQEIGKKIKLV